MKRKEQKPKGSVEAEDVREDKRPVEDYPGSVEKALSVGDEDNSGSEGSKPVDKKSRGAPRMIVQLGLILLCLVVGAVGLHFIKSKMLKSSSPVKTAVASATRIIRPVPQPDYRKMLDFLIMYRVQGREMLTAMRMEAVFNSVLKYQDFKRHTVVFRDVVYNFLLGQDAADNTEKSWRSVFGKNLLEYLRIKLPESCPDRIRLTQIENL